MTMGTTIAVFLRRRAERNVRPLYQLFLAQFSLPLKSKKYQTEYRIGDAISTSIP